MTDVLELEIYNMVTVLLEYLDLSAVFLWANVELRNPVLTFF